MEHIYELLDEVRDLRKRIRTADLKGTITKRTLVGWDDRSFDLIESVILKLDELAERLDLFEQQETGKTTRVISVKGRAKKTAKKTAKKKK